MTIGEFIDILLEGELTIERLKRFGNKLDEFSQEYSITRVDPCYQRNVQIEMSLQ